MDFISAVAEAAAIPEFVENYDRLTGNHFSGVLKASPFERMIDEATGSSAAEVALFCKFFYEYVWSRLPDEAFAGSA